MSKPESWQTPPQLAADLQVAPEKVIGLIRSGEIEAVNIANKGSGRPRYRISPDARAAFLNRRRVVPPTPIVRSRRQKQTAVKEYF